MNPQVPAVLFELAGLLGRNAAPDVPAPERASDLGLSAMLLMIAGEVWDRQAHILVEENRALRSLLGEPGGDPDLRLSSLGVENNRLRGLLIARHAQAEADGDEDLQRRIWAELTASTERRKIASAPI
jgi:hypothetical protein